MNDNYIYINNNSISNELCSDIIELFENQPSGKHEGHTLDGLNKEVKDTLDFLIPKTDKKWIKIYKFLEKELARNLDKYFISLKNNSSDDYDFGGLKLYYDYYQVQKYTANKGKYIFHNDADIDLKKNKYRIITFIWYLNDVCEGGETCLNNNISIKPQTGKLLLFPATWTYPHCGKMPISNNKYIITGWIFTDI